MPSHVLRYPVFYLSPAGGNFSEPHKTWSSAIIIIPHPIMRNRLDILTEYV